MYDTKYIVKGGARLSTLEEEVNDYIKNIPCTDIIIAYVCAGICELTYKEHHCGGIELNLHTNQNVYEHIVDLKENLRRRHPLSVVGVATIPMIKFIKAQAHFKLIKQLHQPKYSKDQLNEKQQKLSESIAVINTNLAALNRTPQYLPGIGSVTPAQLFLHQDVEKDVIRKSQSKRVVYKRIPDKKLIDGVHASEAVSDVWFSALHANFMKICSAISDLL